MIFTFKHRNTPLFNVDITVSNKGVKINRVVTKYQYIYRETLPIQIQNCQISHLNTELENWFKQRAIPKDRTGLQDLIDTLMGQHVDNPYETAQILALCSYGANMTDGYWFSPKNDYTLSLPKHPLDGFVIKKHPKYAGLGMADAPFFRLAITKEAPLNLIDCNFVAMDFNISGDKKKYLTSEDGFYYVYKLMDNAPERIDNIILAMKEYPKIINPVKPLPDRSGYGNRCQVNEKISFMSLEDMCLSVGATASWENLIKAAKSFGLNPSYFEDFKDIKHKYFKDTLGYEYKAFYKNSGFLYNNRDKSLIKPVVLL